MPHEEAKAGPQANGLESVREPYWKGEGHTLRCTEGRSSEASCGAQREGTEEPPALIFPQLPRTKPWVLLELAPTAWLYMMARLLGPKCLPNHHFPAPPLCMCRQPRRPTGVRRCWGWWCWRRLSGTLAFASSEQQTSGRAELPFLQAGPERATGCCPLPHPCIHVQRSSA